MAQIQIRTVLLVEDALKSGSTESGLILVTPTSDQLASLGEHSRQRLAPYCEVGRNVSLRVVAPGWDSVVIALAKVIECEELQRQEQAAQIEAEHVSYRTMISLLETRQYFEPDSMPPAERSDLRQQPGVTWQSAPNYSRTDEASCSLWSALERLRAAQFAQLVREADGRLVPVEAHLVGQGEKTEISKQASAVLQAANRSSLEYAPNAQAVCTLMKTTREQARAAAEIERRRLIRNVVQDQGDRSQLERFDADVLPAEELEVLLRLYLFHWARGFAMYEEISEQEVAAECDCNFDDVRFSASDYAGPFGPKSWELLQSIRKAAPSDAIIQARQHVGYQRGNTGADDPEVRKESIRVTREYAGEKHSLELAAE